MPLLLFAAQGVDKTFKLAVEQSKAGLKLHRVFGVLRLLNLQVNGVLVQGRLGRHAITKGRISRGHTLSINMFAVAAIELKLTALGLGILLRQYRGEIKITGFEVRRIGIGHVVGQDLGALGTKTECLVMTVEGAFEADAHDR